MVVKLRHDGAEFINLTTFNNKIIKFKDLNPYAGSRNPRTLLITVGKFNNSTCFHPTKLCHGHISSCCLAFPCTIYPNYTPTPKLEIPQNSMLYMDSSNHFRVNGCSFEYIFA